MLVPEMDGDFRIHTFVEFFNEQCFQISYEPPSEFRNEVFEVGTPTPIPIWIDGRFNVILGDADKDEPEKQFGPLARHNEVLRDISRLLDDARSGRIKDQLETWAAESFSNSFADVFHEEPTRARYWITRYRIAVAKARRTMPPPHPIDQKLRAVATTWLHRFGTKSDLSKIGGLLGSTKNKVFSKRQITDILFAFLMNALYAEDHRRLDDYFNEASLHRAFPAGLYSYYIENGWPRVPFEYAQLDDFGERMLEALAAGEDNEDFEASAKLAFLFYGRAKLPDQIDGLARTYLKRADAGFRFAREEAREVFRDKKQRDVWKIYAQNLLDAHRLLMDIDGIVNGVERMRRTPTNNRFGITLEYLKDVKLIARGK